MDESWWRYVPGVVSVGILCLLATACAGPPTVDDVERILRHRLTENAHGRLEMLSVRQTNAQEGEVMGVSLYSIEYEVEVEVTEAAYWQRRDPLSNEVLFLTESAPAGSGGAAAQLMLGATGYRAFPKGHRETLKGELVFEKTERGWRTNAGELLDELAAAPAENPSESLETEDRTPITARSQADDAGAALRTVKADLKNVAAFQEIHYAEEFRYADDVAVFEASLGPTTVEIIYASLKGWAAVAQQAGIQCGMWYSQDYAVDEAKSALARRIPGFAGASPGEVVCNTEPTDASPSTPSTRTQVSTSQARGDERTRAYRAAMRSDLLNLQAFEDDYRSAHGEYIDDLGPLRLDHSAGVTLEIFHASADSWGAVATHEITPVSCGIWRGAQEARQELSRRLAFPVDSLPEGRAKCNG